MSEQVIDRRWDRTKEIYPEILLHEYQLYAFELVLEAAPNEEEREYAQEQVRLQRAKVAKLRSEINEDTPVIVIGYLPVEIMTEAEVIEEAARKDSDLSEADRVRRNLDADRLIVRWGIQGHLNCRMGDAEIPFDTAGEEIDGVAHEVVGRKSMQYYERRRWLKALRWAIWEFSTLSEEKKSKSSSTSGEEQPTSGATSVG